MHEYFDHEEARRFFKFATFAMIVLGVFLVAKSLDAFRDWRAPQAAYSTIVVTGYGETFATPDLATFTFSVSADANSVATAQETVTKKIDAILEGLKGQGVKEDDIRTTDYTVYPKYAYTQAVCTQNYCPPGRQVPDGYTVSHSISVKVRDTAKAGEAIAVAGQNGATNISSIMFTLDDPNAPQNDARDKAVKEAKEKAKTLAKSLGVSLGRIVDFSDNSYTPTPYYSAEAGGLVAADTKSVAPTLPEGQNKFTSNVTVTYEIR